MDSFPLVLPVRFSGGGLTMQTTTGRASPEALFIRCVVPPREGVEIALSLMLPGRDALHLRGVVQAPAQGAVEPGFWVLLDGLSPDDQARLSAVLPGGARAAERRALERARKRLKVSWASAREFLVAYSDNISRGGIFVVTDAPPALREVVDLSLELPDDNPIPARTQAEVVQRVTVEEARAQGRIAGAGLQFVGAGDDFRARLDACMEHLLTAG